MDVVLPVDVKYDMVSPCSDCPFLKTSPFHQGVAESMVQYLESMEDGTFAHTCHKTDNRPAVDGPRNHKGDTQHCVGALLMLMKTGNQKPKRRRKTWNWMQRGLMYGLTTRRLSNEKFSALSREADRRKDVFTVNEMIVFYLHGIAKLMKDESHAIEDE